MLLLLPWAWALVQVLRHHHLDSGAVGIVVGVSVGLPALWLAWVGYREASRSGTRLSELTLDQVADQLAVAVGAQWEAEAAIRRLNDPYPLPVSWDPADAALTDAWESLLMLAESGAGWPEPPQEGTWAAGPSDLAGAGSDLVNVLARVPTGRLVVLGEPGAGKTMLMVRLVLDLLARRAAGGPVPILASIASWNPAGQDLQGWLAGQLMIDHPALAAASPTGRREPTQAAALLASRHVLMILDGLDEIPEAVRGPAISRINDALRPGEQLVLACRSQQYRDAVRPEGGAEVTLHGAAAVQLNPLDADAVRAYLCPATSGPGTQARWAPVLAELDTPAPVGRALETPLMVGLARAIYSPRPGELAGRLRDPAELCDPGLADRATVEALLFDAFIPAAYRQNPASHWKVPKAERWLVFLARHLEYKIAGPDLAWWQLPQAAQTAGHEGRGTRLAVAVSAAIAVAAGVVLGVQYGFWSGVLGAFSFGMGFWGLRSTVAEAMRSQKAPADISSAASPRALLLQARNKILVSATIWAVVLTVGVVIYWLFTRSVASAVFIGLGSAVGVGIPLFLSAAWSGYEIARVQLALRRSLPWRLMGFLADAHRRGVLRQAGAVYQFRHIELQHRLATRRPNRPKGF
jgi:hypothetical protein